MPYGTVNADLMTTSDGVSSAGLYGFKNKIINGSMQIDQRNAGASVTPTTSNTYTLDRWSAFLSQSSKYSVQQSSTAPTGFTKSLLATSLSAYTVGSSEFFSLLQVIEGFNSADLAWGTANAATVTLSFWVRSSLTGTFGGAVQSYAGDANYPFSYTISAANTWEQKTVTITGPTTGTFPTNNTASIAVGFCLGAGATVSGTAGSWSSTVYRSTTGATSVVGTSGATFYITGVQLEKGSTATSFDYRPYGTELQLCQRYYYKKQGAAYTFSGYAANTVSFRASGNFPVTMRTPATALEQSGTASHYTVVGGGQSSAVCSAVPTFLTADVDNWQITANVASGLVVYNCGVVNINSSGYLAWSAEL